MKLNKFKYFYPEKPKLLRKGQLMFKKLSKDPGWIAEPKYNGSRLQLHLINGVALFFGRHGKELVYTASPSILALLKNLPQKGYYLFDGELRHNKTKNVRNKLVIWDCFIYNGHIQNDKPYWARRSLLEGLDLFREDIEPVSLITQYKDNFKSHFDKLRNFEEFEGLVLKNIQGKLNLGVNGCIESRWMFKVRKETGRHKW